MASLDSHNGPSYLTLIVVGSLVANAALWYGLSRGANQVVTPAPLPELVFDRVTVEKKDPIHPKKLVFRSIPPPTPPKQKQPEVTPKKPPPPPQGAHNKIVTSKNSSKAPDNFKAPGDGKAAPGALIIQQPGNNTVTAPTPPPVAPPTTPPPPPQTDTKPTQPTQTPTAPPPPPPPVEHDDPPPPPPAPPKPKGETRDAAPSHQVSVEIPDSLKNRTFKTFVRVKVQIAADGTFQVVLRTSSGNPDIDKLVLNALNKWTWKPALKDGDAVDSVQLFRFNFSVE